MKKLYLLFALFSSLNLSAQVLEEFVISMEPLTIANAPGVHTYSWGKTDDHKWVIVGGRIDGLHQRQPFATFLEQDNNKFIFVIDPQSEQVWEANLNVLPASMFEQLQTTNQQFKQRDSILYITGGYGFSATAGDHITFPNLTAISLNEVADAVISGQSIIPYFRQITDFNMKQTGGQLGLIDSTFYLVGGNLFDGRYNPQGPDFGPGFVQIYSNEIRKFKILDDGINLSIYDYSAVHDTVNLHRRDYNMVPQIFPDGTFGFTAFTGVFDYDDTPYLNTVDITPSGYTVNNNFEQLLSQYHCAQLAISDAQGNAMHNIFFGGLSQFQFDATGTLVEDINVPFVKTISKTTRFSDGSMQEVDLGYIEMPVLVGAGAEFIPVHDSMYFNDILKLNDLPEGITLVGYIYGGIESTAENIFTVNDGTQSFASNTIFKVYINKSETSVEEIPVNGEIVINLDVHPNPVVNDVTISLNTPDANDVLIQIHNIDGRLMFQNTYTAPYAGSFEKTLDLSQYPTGSYLVTVFSGTFKDQVMIVKD